MTYIGSSWGQNLMLSDDTCSICDVSALRKLTGIHKSPISCSIVFLRYVSIQFFFSTNVCRVITVAIPHSVAASSVKRYVDEIYVFKHTSLIPPPQLFPPLSLVKLVIPVSCKFFSIFTCVSLLGHIFFSKWLSIVLLLLMKFKKYAHVLQYS